MRNILLIILSCLMLVCQGCDDSYNIPDKGPKINESELQALLDIYISIVDESKYLWGSSQPTGWRGVTFELDSTTNEYVAVKIEIGYFKDNTSSKLPESMSQLKHLRILKLLVPLSNSIQLSEGLCECPLEYLSIGPQDRYNSIDRRNCITGPFPKNFGKLGHTLKYLALECSNIDEEILPYIETFPHLEDCSLPCNNIKGKVPMLSKPFWFAYNEFTEFDWSYFEPSKDINTLPAFRYNNIEGPISIDINAWKLTIGQSWLDELNQRFNTILYGNPVFAEWEALYEELKAQESAH